MKLQTPCKSCGSTINLKANEPSRMDLENKWGSEFEYTCKVCKKSSMYHVNEVNARANRELIFIGGVIGMVLCGLFLFTFSGLLMWLFFLVALPTILSIVRGEAVKKRENNFNRYKVSTKRNYKPKNLSKHQ